MKKIIWVFGASATGKLTLINSLYNKDENTINTFNMANKKISICEVTLEDRVPKECDYIDTDIYDDSLMDEDNLYFNRKRAIKRRSLIMHDALNFINDDNDILLIKGQENDLNKKRGDILNNFLRKYGSINNIEIEVYLLKVADEDLLRKRLQSKPWFKTFADEEAKKRFLNEVLENQERHIETIINFFNTYDISISLIESLEKNYRKDDTYGKSSNTRR